MQINVVPPELTACFDMRITPKWSAAEATKFLESICEEAGLGVKYEYLFRSDHGFAQTPIKSNPWFDAFEAASKSL